MCLERRGVSNDGCEAVLCTLFSLTLNARNVAHDLALLHSSTDVDVAM